MIYRVLATGLLAGLVAGLAVATLQTFSTTPLILEAEVYEKAAEKAEGASAVPGEARLILVQDAHEHAHGAAGEEEEWEPADGVERTVYASVATIATAVGFSLLLLAGMLLAGDAITERTAVAWAAAGFVVTGLAPGVGLSPEVPGMPAADLVARQSWWFLTAALTALSLWLFLRSESGWLRALAVVLILVPHIIGAPHLVGEEKSLVPPELSARFAAVSLAVQATLWVASGYLVGFFWQWLGRKGADATA